MYPPFSWHSVNELRDCLYYVQKYILKPRCASPIASNEPSRKRKQREDDLSKPSSPAAPISLHYNSRSSSELSATSTGSSSTPATGTSRLGKESREPSVYNVVLSKREGYITAKPSVDAGVVRADVFSLPTQDMKDRATTSCTTQAEKQIQAEFLARLRKLSGPKTTLVNTIDNTTPALDFTFIENSVHTEGVKAADPGTLIGCQQCRADMGQNIGCEYTRKCECLEFAAVDTARLNTQELVTRYKRFLAKKCGSEDLPKRFPYHSSGHRAHCLVSFYLEARHPIYECNDLCRCGPRCKNRVVQKGRRVGLEIFKTKNRGWGLRCVEPLKEGQFIDTYRGEIITCAEADRREEANRPEEAISNISKASYMFALDKHVGVDGQPDPDTGLSISDCYVVDGEKMSGPTRFINHSCEPNCRQYTVSYNKYDFRIYELAFFAYRDIPAFEELTFDYQDHDGDDAGMRQKEGASTKVECLCGASKCRGTMWG
ncbi:hypothetical protein LTR28_009691 [Elasticomyces elasticus]|nr:hypothetical protein LTR28_009691 [Elasticomyces elasticus]